MAKISLAAIKAIFVTGAVPTEAQYSDTFDSFRHKDNLLAQNEVTNLAPLTATVNPAATIAVPSDVIIREVVIKNVTTGGDLRIGTTPGGNELSEEPVLTGQVYIVDLGTYFSSSGSIYFSGGPVCDVKLYIQ